MSDYTLTRGEQTRHEILQAANALFIQQGYHGTSMRQIAKKTHMALGSLYNYFESKEIVFREVLFEYHPYHEVLPFLKDAEGENVEEFIRNATSRMVRALENRPGFLNLMFIEMVEFKGIHMGDLFQVIYPQGLQVVQRITGKFGEQIRPFPPAIIMRSVLGLFFGYYLTTVAFAKYTPTEFNINAMEYLTDIYLHGIMEQKP